MSDGLDTKIADLQDKIQQRAHQEIEHIHKNQQLFVRSITLIAALAFAVIAFIFGSNFMDHNQQILEMRTRIGEESARFLEQEKLRLKEEYASLVKAEMEKAMKIQLDGLEARFTEVIKGHLEDQETKEQIQVISSAIVAELSAQGFVKEFEEYKKVVSDMQSEIKRNNVMLYQEFEEIRTKLPSPRFGSRRGSRDGIGDDVDGIGVGDPESPGSLEPPISVPGGEGSS